MKEILVKKKYNDNASSKKFLKTKTIMVCLKIKWSQFSESS